MGEADLEELEGEKMSVKIMLKGTVDEIEKFVDEVMIPGVKLVCKEREDGSFFKITQNDEKYFPNSKNPDIKVRYLGGYFPADHRPGHGQETDQG